MANLDMQESHFYQHENDENQTMIEFTLLGFHGLRIFKVPLFILFLLIYCATILGNILIIALVSTSTNLHSPMFFFLQHLSISDIILITNIVPIILHIVINDVAYMSLDGCLTQYFICGCTDGYECLLLTVMSYDRYLAICSPLHYSSIMDHHLCITLVAMCWLLAFTVAISCAISLKMQHFYGQNVIDHFFCDPAALMELSFSDTLLVKIEILLLAIAEVVLPFLFIIITYVCIGFTIQKIKSNTGRQKAFSTCSSHLAVVGLFYGTLTGMYVVPHGAHSVTINKLLSFLYTVVIPFLNPIIYSMRNNEMKEALDKFIRNWKLHHY